MIERDRISTIIAWLIVLLFLGGWELMVRGLSLPEYLLPAPSRVFQVLFQNISLYLESSLITLSEALLGLLLGVTAGVVIAALLSMQPRLEGGVMSLAILLKSTPLVAIAPLFTLWLGFGMLPKVLITGLMTFFPVLVNVLYGFQHPEAALIDLFASWHTGKREMFLRLRLPTALPYLFSALKISLPLALIGAVVAEWTGASGGLGRTMWLAYTNLNLPFLFAAIFILAASGVIAYRSLMWLESRVVFWQKPKID
jgi:NitT/TauT family transport system permease protein